MAYKLSNIESNDRSSIFKSLLRISLRSSSDTSKRVKIVTDFQTYKTYDVRTYNGNHRKENRLAGSEDASVHLETFGGSYLAKVCSMPTS